MPPQIKQILDAPTATKLLMWLFGILQAIAVAVGSIVLGDVRDTKEGLAQFKIEVAKSIGGLETEVARGNAKLEGLKEQHANTAAQVREIQREIKH